MVLCKLPVQSGEYLKEKKAATSPGIAFHKKKKKGLTQIMFILLNCLCILQDTQCFETYSGAVVKVAMSGAHPT